MAEPCPAPDWQIAHWLNAPSPLAQLRGKVVLAVVNSLRLERLPDPVSSPIPAPRSGGEAERARRDADISAMAGPAVERS